MLLKKKYGVKLLFVALLVLPWVQAIGQQKGEELFIEDSFYLNGLEQKIMTAVKQQKPKTISQIQIETKFLVDDQSVSLSLPTTNNSKILSPEEIYAQNKSAVLIVGRLNHANPELAPMADPIATAFFISEDGIAVTNRHVFGEMIYSKKSVDSLKLSKDSSLYYVQNFEGEIFTIDKILAYSASNDVLIFKVNTGNKKVSFIPLGDPLPVGSKVFVIAHPEQNYYFLSEGIVAKNSKLVNPANPKQRQWRMTITADYAVGSSGGPIINSSGNLVGIVSSTSNIYGSKTEKIPLQMVLKNAISVIAIKELFKP
ncbi:serine protease [Sphingobacterium daejeonense]|uniref:Serine protease n=1 Tax=Sphingobacterium daejeonense TaxID=371142 RepID=A0ABW3RL21_9SPHI